MKDPLDEALGLPPMDRESREVTVPEKTTEDQDYEFARQNLYRLIAKAEDHLDELGDIAYVSQHARAYEVYSGLLKTTLEANRELLELKKAHQATSGETGGPRTINNNLIMTSDEVLRMIKGKKAEPDDEV